MMTEHLEQGPKGKSELPAHTLGGAGGGPESSVEQLFEQRRAQRERLDMHRHEQERQLALWKRQASKHRGESWQQEKEGDMEKLSEDGSETGRKEEAVAGSLSLSRSLSLSHWRAQSPSRFHRPSIATLVPDKQTLYGALMRSPRTAHELLESDDDEPEEGFGDLGGGFLSSAPCDDTASEPVRARCQLPGASAGLHAQKEEKEKSQFGQEREETSPWSDAPIGFEADAAALRQDVTHAQEPTYTTGAADRPAQSAKQTDPLDRQVKLGLDLHLDGPPNSQHRAEFETVLICDLSKASGLRLVGSELLSQGSRSVEPRTPATTLGGSELAPPSSRSVEEAEILVKRICPTVEEIQIATTDVVVEHVVVKHVAAGSRQFSEGKSSWGSWLFENETRKCARCDKRTHKSSWKAW